MPVPTAPATVDNEPRTGAGAGPLAAAGALLVLYPALRPWSDATPDGAPHALASPAWIPAHLAAVAGFVLVAFALQNLHVTLARTGGARLARFASGLWAIGTALVLPYYGAEAFALHALGERIVRTGDTGLLEVAEATRMGAWQVTTFAAGLLLLAAAGVLVAAAAARSGVLPRWAGLPFALTFALYLPQFFGPPALRIAHGVLAAVGCLVLAAAMRRATARG
jgi:hypothetical protein